MMDIQFEFLRSVGQANLGLNFPLFQTMFRSLIVLNACMDIALVENGKFLLAARKFRRATSTDYIISINSEDMSRGSTTYVGKLRYSQSLNFCFVS